MPHDVNGTELNVGDVVYVPCKVTDVQTGTDYCNLSVETEYPMYPGEHKTLITLNARQVFKGQLQPRRPPGPPNPPKPERPTEVA